MQNIDSASVGGIRNLENLSNEEIKSVLENKNVKIFFKIEDLERPLKNGIL